MYKTLEEAQAAIEALSKLLFNRYTYVILCTDGIYKYQRMGDNYNPGDSVEVYYYFHGYGGKTYSVAYANWNKERTQTNPYIYSLLGD